nr:pancreatic lipase-related protein 3 [Drosophila bipectinata]
MQAGLVIFLFFAFLGATVYGDTEFLLHTRRIRDTPQQVDPEVESLLRSSFYAADPTVVSLPRWQGNSSSPELQAVVAAQLDQHASNVISVDLADASDEAEVLEKVSKMVILLNKNFDVPLEDILLVGFAEGAHLAGGVAAKVHADLGHKPLHLTALDPTSGESLQHVLSPSDAEFVEVVHTDSGGEGTWETLGHVDYFPNGGTSQPGCSEGSCSHERAFELLAEMWSPANDFVSAVCGSVETMSAQNCRWSSLKMGQRGEERPTSGIYFLETRQSSPFGRGAYHISFL